MHSAFKTHHECQTVAVCSSACIFFFFFFHFFCANSSNKWLLTRKWSEPFDMCLGTCHNTSLLPYSYFFTALDILRFFIGYLLCKFRNIVYLEFRSIFEMYQKHTDKKSSEFIHIWLFGQFRFIPTFHLCNSRRKKIPFHYK